MTNQSSSEAPHSDNIENQEGGEATDKKQLSDFENMLTQLNRGIDDTLLQRFDATTGETVTQYEQRKQESNEPHFTLATSPTRKTGKDD